jgi:hypothetical protein
VRIDDIMVLSVNSRGMNIILKTNQFAEINELKLHEISDLLIYIHSEYNKERFEYFVFMKSKLVYKVRADKKKVATMEYTLISVEKYNKNNFKTTKKY